MFTVPTNIIFIYDNYVDYQATDITPSSTYSSSLTADNLKYPSRTKVWRSATNAATNTYPYLTFDFGSAVTVDALGLVNHNLTAGSHAIYLCGNSADSWGTVPYEEYFAYPDTGGGAIDTNKWRLIAPPFLKFTRVGSSSPAYRYWRLYFESQGQLNYIEVGKIFMGTYFQCSKNFLFGNTHKITDTSKVETTNYGYFQSIKSHILTKIELEIKRLDNDEFYNDFLKLYYAVGQTEFFIMAMSPDTAFGRYFKSFYGKFCSELAGINPSVNSNNLKVDFMEVP